jgi:hypothetical protein
MGNMWETPLAELINNYHPDSHPVCGPLIRGGPAELVKVLGVKPKPGYIDECHLCFSARRAKIDNYADYLTPRQVYGLD